MIQLPIHVDTFGFAVREMGKNGKRKKNRCGRDALYYVLHYLFPNIFNPQFLNPERCEDLRLFGFRLPDWFPAYSGTALNRVPKFLKTFGVKTYTNGILLTKSFDFAKVSMFRTGRISFKRCMELLEENLKKGNPCVIDLPAPEVGPFMNHVIFTYAFDDQYAYMIDTWKLPCFEYEKNSTDPHKYLMRYPIAALEKRWNTGGVLWTFEKEKAQG